MLTRVFTVNKKTGKKEEKKLRKKKLRNKQNYLYM